MQDGLFHNSKYNPKNESVYKLLNDYEKDYKKLFLKIKNDWKTIIRTYFKETLGLKFNKKWITNFGNQDSFIHINILSDADDDLLRLIDEHFSELNFDEYVLLKKYLEFSKAALPYFKNDEQRHAINLINYCEEYFKKYDLQKIIKLLFSGRKNSTDIWGSYFFKSHEVHLYYLPLIIFAKLKEVSIEYCLVTVLAHELAHAFHHIGLDGDNISWSKMSESNIFIIEGLAQYYTERFVEDYSIQFPALDKSYQAMLACQSGPYRIHEKWNQDFKKEHVKHALMQTRRTGISKLIEFEEALKIARKSLK